MIEKLISLVIWIATLIIIWVKSHNISAMYIFGIVEFLLFLMIWFSDFVSENLMPFVSIIWAPMARDFSNYSRSGYSMAIKLIGWVLVILLLGVSFCVKAQI